MDDGPTNAPGQPARGSLRRGLRVIEAVAAAGSDRLTVSEIAQEIGLDKGTVSRLVSPLVEAGYLQRRPDRGIALDIGILRLTNGYAGESDIRNAAHGPMKQFAEEIGATVHLAIPSGLQVIYLDQVRPKRDIHIAMIIGEHADQHVTATGRALLHTLPLAEQRDRVRALVRSPHDPSLAFDAEEYEASRQHFESHGFTFLWRDDGIVRIAAPIVLNAGKAVGAIGVFLASVAARDVLLEIGAGCVATANAVADRLDMTPRTDGEQ